MEWACFDIGADSFISRDVWAELGENVGVLDAETPSSKSPPEIAAGDACADRGNQAVFGYYDPGTYDYKMPIYLLLRMTLEWMHEPYDGTREYESVALTWDEVCSNAGITDSDHWLRTVFWYYNGTPTYYVDDLVWSRRWWYRGFIKHYQWCRFKCIQEHTGAGDKKPGETGGAAYWERVHDLIEPSWLNDFRDVIDYIDQNS